jgi:hypothetical protein
MPVSNDDLVETAMMAAQLMGKPELAVEILNGKLPAREAVPLLAGLVIGMLDNLFIPLTSAQGRSSGFNPSTHPLTINVVMKDGSALSVILEASG